ncbi:MAG: PhnD/SsuA/transferrin family substrate-binding protein [Gemmataceae bacterium]|nr:PhnD/SsuA/transferrin family substrate-binding protein [Gemmataceae bacterium]
MATSPPFTPGYKSPRLRIFMLLLVPAVLAGSAGAFFYVQASKTTDADYTALVGDYVARFGPRTSLDVGYTDADGDLIADLPQDKAAWLDPKEIVFSGIVFDASEKSQAVWKSLMDHLAKETGRKVTFASEMGGVDEQMEALKAGKLHVTAFATGSVPAAVNSAGFIPLVAPADEAGKFAYQMEIIVPASSVIQNPSELRGRKVTFSSMSSNAGMKAPTYFLSEKFGLQFGKDYAFHLSGSYDRSLEGIASGKFTAAPIANDFLRRAVARGTIEISKYRSIYKSDDFPPLCFGHPHHLTPELATKVRDGLLSFSWKGTAVETEYAPAGLAKFVPVDYKRDWALVRTVDEGMLKLAKQR